jgi:uncharacterized protein YjiS (DUF1127 family)
VRESLAKQRGPGPRPLLDPYSCKRHVLSVMGEESRFRSRWFVEVLSPRGFARFQASRGSTNRPGCSNVVPLRPVAGIRTAVPRGLSERAEQARDRHRRRRNALLDGDDPQLRDLGVTPKIGGSVLTHRLRVNLSRTTRRRPNDVGESVFPRSSIQAHPNASDSPPTTAWYAPLLVHSRRTTAVAYRHGMLSSLPRAAASSRFVTQASRRFPFGAVLFLSSHQRQRMYRRADKGIGDPLWQLPVSFVDRADRRHFAKAAAFGNGVDLA